MSAISTEQGKAGKKKFFSLVSGLGLLITGLLIAVIIYYWDEIQHAQSYGYAGGFLVSLLGGITVIPAPSLLVTFTLGRLLNPLYVGLVSGFGEALGGLTIYLTGAGAGTIWSRLRSKEQTLEHQPRERYDIVSPVRSQFWSKGESYYNRLVRWVGGRSGALVLFVVSMMVISPFYFAALAAGSLRMGLARFFLISWAGKTVKGLAIAFAGYWGLHLLSKWLGF